MGWQLKEQIADLLDEEQGKTEYGEAFKELANKIIGLLGKFEDDTR